jgi:hypothetical protein
MDRFYVVFKVDADKLSDLIKAGRQFTSFAAKVLPAYGKHDPDRKELLTRDALARQEGENLDGSPRRETLMIHDFNLDDPIPVNGTPPVAPRRGELPDLPFGATNFGGPTKHGPNKKPYEFANGEQNKGIKGEDLVLQVLSSAQRVFSTVEIKDEFQRHGFHRASATTPLSNLLRDEKIKRVALGRYCMPGLIIRK